MSHEPCRHVLCDVMMQVSSTRSSLPQVRLVYLGAGSSSRAPPMNIWKTNEIVGHPAASATSARML